MLCPSFKLTQEHRVVIHVVTGCMSASVSTVVMDFSDHLTGSRHLLTNDCFDSKLLPTSSEPHNLGHVFTK